MNRRRVRLRHIEDGREKNQHPDVDVQVSNRLELPSPPRPPLTAATSSFRLGFIGIMGKSSKKMRKVQQRDISSEDDDNIKQRILNADSEKYVIKDDSSIGDDNNDSEEEYDSEMDSMNLENEEDFLVNDTTREDDDDESESDEQDDDDADADGMDMKIEDNNHGDLEELEKEYKDLRNEEQDLFRNIRRDQDDDILKGQAVKNQRLENEEDFLVNDTTREDDDDESESDEQDDDDADADGMDMKIEDNNHGDLEELEKEYKDLRNEEQDLFRNIRRDQDDDILKGQAVKNQRLENEEDFLVNDTTREDDDDESESDEQDDDDADADGMDMKIEDNNHGDLEELEKEYKDLRNEEQDLFRNIRRDQDDDILKGQAVKNQRALWDKTLEFRFLLQKPFSTSNRLPQEPIRSGFCNSSEGVKEAYSDLIDSTKKTLDSILELQETLVEKNPSIMDAVEDGDAAQYSKSLDAFRNSTESDEEWFKISQMQSRIAPFRNMSVDKWQRKTQVTSGAAGMKNKFQAFNQNISEQVASYMRDPSRMIKGMQQRSSVVPVFGDVSDSTVDKDEAINADGDPELLDDSDFYQQLLREFFETVDAGSSESAFYALKRLQTKKRKIVDRRASKSRKIRYHVHEKIVNFMAPEPMNIPPMAPKLFENLFGLKTLKPASVS
ncbi:hypothetical protein L1987_48786 [Smallanthus sonchifolius]|uniref:Uncharacterized protein n=1 Tax=Smallanthus sonchifolius TaxID=185202 RepID=A0ACB9FSN8_9ASTR|nr:hypothetical protein L1987_48786 [Smallanthus sonchifolius]